jgi:hypothetical protein
MQLAGVVAVEIAGGPEIPFHPGREVGLLLFLEFKFLFIYLRITDLVLLPEMCNFCLASGFFFFFFFFSEIHQGT